MKHYDPIEWIFYREEALSEDKMIAMEKHLYICDECLEIFTSIIDDEEIIAAEKSLSPDLTLNIMESIENIRPISSINRKRSNKSYRDMFIYYTAVASVAIMLTLGGFYSRLIDIVPNITKSTTVKENVKIPEMVAGISGRIVNRTSDFINDIEKTKTREGLR
ncbi:MAG: hypothetical protein GX329_00250 [Tissierellia bacterium]|nr:hypothetical protein [Tissierellia bacterium]